jgi:hypothetical protein
MNAWMFHHQVVMRTLGINAAFKEERPAQDAAKLQGFLGADAASIARFDRDNGWHTLLGDTRCTVYDGDPMDRSRPPPRVVATGDLGGDNMYRVSLSKLVKAREHARIARISVPTERIMQADATPAETLNLWHLRLGHHHLRGLSEGIKQGLIKA